VQSESWRLSLRLRLLVSLLPRIALESHVNSWISGDKNSIAESNASLKAFQLRQGHFFSSFISLSYRLQSICRQTCIFGMINPILLYSLERPASILVAGSAPSFASSILMLAHFAHLVFLSPKDLKRLSAVSISPVSTAHAIAKALDLSA
jgi:hypothetical protein